MPGEPARHVLIAAQSGRALAAAARRAGLAPLVADLFGDLDTRRIARRWVLLAPDREGGIADAGFVEALQTLAEGVPADSIVGLAYASGFEDRPRLLDAAARHWPLLGNAPKTLRDLKDPACFAALCRDLAIPHPEISLTPPPDAGGWLTKRAGASGGAHVAPMRAGDVARTGCYFQRRVAGAPVSALFVAGRREARMLGFSSQWADPAPGAPFRFGGAAGPVAVDDAVAGAMTRAVRGIARARGLRGLNSADFLVDGATVWLLEINPRPGATLEVFDGEAVPLFAWHCAGCEGSLLLPAAVSSKNDSAYEAPPRNPLPRSGGGQGGGGAELGQWWGGAAPSVGFADQSALASTPAARERNSRRAIAIAYAQGAPFPMPAFDWPAWVMDQQPPGTILTDGAPLCTVLGQGGTAAAARESALRRSSAIKARIYQQDGGETADGQRG